MRNLSFLYALRREVVRNDNGTLIGATALPEGLYTPFGVRWFGTVFCIQIISHPYYNFYTPFGVRWFGTGLDMHGLVRSAKRFLYALRREVVRNPTPVDGSLTSTFGRPLHARLARVSTRS